MGQIPLYLLAVLIGFAYAIKYGKRAKKEIDKQEASKYEINNLEKTNDKNKSNEHKTQ